uniref:C-type lectin domain-containing protein n=1 Tax=Anopheles farauti TaxID=69004 RepID=A0A182QVH7_9DIPT
MQAKLFTVIFVVLAVAEIQSALAVRYQAYTDDSSFLTAQNKCIKKGGRLAGIDTQAQQNQVEKLLIATGLSNAGWWLGGTDFGMARSFFWVGRNYEVGSVNGYTNFANGEPSSPNTEHCLMIIHNPSNPKYKWFDFHCSHTTYYICEFDF